VAVHESALTALKLSMSVGSNGLITDILLDYRKKDKMRQGR